MVLKGIAFRFWSGLWSETQIFSASVVANFLTLLTYMPVLEREFESLRSLQNKSKPENKVINIFQSF